jgi:hypothetical protein
MSIKFNIPDPTYKLLGEFKVSAYRYMKPEFKFLKLLKKELIREGSDDGACDLQLNSYP